MTLAHTITQKATQQVKWAALIEVVRLSVSPIVTVLLARLLAPEAFGLVSTAAICIGFAQMFWDAGLSKAIIQTNESPGEAANVVFWTNALLGVLIYALLYAAAPLIAAFFKAPMGTTVFRVIGLTIVLASLSSVQRALCVRDLRFKKLLWIQLSTAMLPGFVSIPMALAGYGVWALVAGTLAGQAVTTVVLWKFSDWRPVFSFDRKMAARLFSFALWVQAESFLAWLMMYGDSLIVGRTMGMEDLGVYRTGWTMLSILFGIALNPVLQLILPTFARLQSDHAALMSAFHKATKLVMAVTIPMGVGLWFCGQDAASVFFGTKWVGLGFVLQTIGLGLAIGWLTGINADIYRAIGKPKINTFVLFGALALYLPVYFLAAQHGLRVFVVSRFCLAVAGLLINACVCSRILKVKWNYLLEDGRSALFSACAMGCFIIAVTELIKCLLPSCGAIVRLSVVVPTGVGIYLGTLALLDREFVAGTYKLLRRAALPEPGGSDAH